MAVRTKVPEGSFLEQPWRIFRIMSEFVEGFEELVEIKPAVCVFGGSRVGEAREIASLFHQTYVQNDAGALVLNIMIQKYLLKPTVTPNATQFDAGIREGRADIVRQILLNIEIAEGDN